jgi:sulfatase modifying factor 1
MLLPRRVVLALLLSGCPQPAEPPAAPEAPESVASVAPATAIAAPLTFDPNAPGSVPELLPTVPRPPVPKPMGVQGTALAPETPQRPALHLMPAGRFIMGSALGEREYAADVRPHPVRLTRPMLITRTEITQAQWKAVIGTEPAYFKACGGQCPVESVSWFDAVAFANALSALEGRTACYRTTDCRGRLGAGCNEGAVRRPWCMGGRCESVERVADCTGYRLPTESEWEYAARGGTYELVHPGPDLLHAHARHSENSAIQYGEEFNCNNPQGQTMRCGVSPVASLLPNAWGLHDMLGNVAEWCEDWYDAEYPTELADDPRGPATGRLRTLRGGAWHAAPRWVSPDLRDAADPVRRSRSIGFRLVRSE